MRLHQAFVFVSAVLAVLHLHGCSSPVHAPVEMRASAAAPSSTFHTVRKGDSLYTIAWIYDRDYQELARWNRIASPYTIYPGQKLYIKAPANRAGAVPSRPVSKSSGQKQAAGSRARRPETAVTKGAGTKPSAKSVSKPSRVVSRYKPQPDRKIKQWYWPVKGPILRSYASNGNKGLDIGGRLGQAVLAAADGRVVYSGSGLIGYGKLIIVKHNKNHLSAYGHNSKILVKEGDDVVGGQRIARMGRAAGRDSMLHFEIRFKGKPVDPSRYLPKT